ncbi:acyl thioesterase [Fusarium mundagurra]|uniref:Acyl thioesterase n=1 Tax=Fusarium mundagurra TaxID=1567541 RepID=A0A8H6DQ99_9HYPO|nr:acyl thioesterase [Fusarium mundagurra]
MLSFRLRTHVMNENTIFEERLKDVKYELSVYRQVMISPDSNVPAKASPASNVFEITERKDLGDDVFTNVFEQWLPPAGRGIYGGSVIALSLAAAQKTVPSDFHIHSCQCTFLHPGSGDRRQTFHVARIRQGSTFATRTVECRQQEDIIIIITVSFTRETDRVSETVEHTVAPFEIPEPPGEQCEERPEWTLTEPFQRHRIDIIDEPASNNSSDNRRIFRQWFRFPGVIPESGGPGAHLHALAFLTDGYFILAAAQLHRIWRLPFALEDVPLFPPKVRSQVQRVNESEGLGSTIEEWAKRPRMAMAMSGWFQKWKVLGQVTGEPWLSNECLQKMGLYWLHAHKREYFDWQKRPLRIILSCKS